MQMPGQNAGGSAHTPVWDTIGPALEFPGDGFPEEAVRLAQQHRAEVTPHLVQALVDYRQVVLDGKVNFDWHLPFFALMLLTQWREPAGFVPLLEIAALPGDLPWIAFDESVEVDFPYALALMSGGAPAAVQALKTRVIENGECDDDVRAVAIDALLVLVAAGGIARTDVLRYCCGLLAHAVEQRTAFNQDYLATTIVSAIYPLRPLEHVAEIRAAYAAGVVDPHRITLSEFEALTHAPEEGGGEFVTGLPLYDDVAADMRHWPCFNREPDDALLEDTADEDLFLPAGPALGNARLWIPQVDAPYVRAAAKPGRNDPCPCGSGKKYKKCCLGKPGEATAGMK